jgi:hypothetical protein
VVECERLLVAPARRPGVKEHVVPGDEDDFACADVRLEGGMESRVRSVALLISAWTRLHSHCRRCRFPRLRA